MIQKLLYIIYIRLIRFVQKRKSGVVYQFNPDRNYPEGWYQGIARKFGIIEAIFGLHYMVHDHWAIVRAGKKVIAAFNDCYEKMTFVGARKAKKIFAVEPL